jgi:hypothetical protein
MIGEQIWWGLGSALATLLAVLALFSWVAWQAYHRR